MRWLGQQTAEAVLSGTALQVVLADDEGLVLDSVGSRFSADALVAAFLGSESSVDRTRRLLNVGPVSEITMRLETENLTLGARFFEHRGQRYLLVTVVPPASSSKILATRIIRECAANMEDRNKAR